MKKFYGQKPSFLPPIVNGRFASASPEHSLCRAGGGDKSGAGGSGTASWGVGKNSLNIFKINWIIVNIGE